MLSGNLPYPRFVDAGSEAVRREVLRVMQTGHPSNGANLRGMEADLAYFLGGLDAVDEASVAVRRTGNAETLLKVDCAATTGTSLRDAARAVREAWLGSLRYASMKRITCHCRRHKRYCASSRRPRLPSCT